MIPAFLFFPRPSTRSRHISSSVRTAASLRGGGLTGTGERTRSGVLLIVTGECPFNGMGDGTLTGLSPLSVNTAGGGGLGVSSLDLSRAAALSRADAFSDLICGCSLASSS